MSSWSPRLSPGADKHTASLLPLRVLVIDDNVDATEMMGVLLTTLGYDVRTALDGIVGIEMAKTFHPNVVLLDIGLPVINGYEVAMRLRALPETSQSLLVALTGYGRDEDRNRSREAGFNIHLTKPVCLDTLESLLTQHAKNFPPMQ